MEAAVAEACLNREPEIPPAAAHLWDWFWQAHQGRQTGANGYLPLSATELKAWEAMTGNVVRREEWSIIRAMDRALLAAVNHQGENAPVRSSGQEIDANAFDAVFG